MDQNQVHGIVISSMPIGEYDRRLEILTDELGRISVFARGARKPSSPLVASSRTFAFGKFSLYQGRASYSLNSADISEYFTALSEDFELSCYGAYFLELSKYFSQEGLEASDQLMLLYYSLKALASGKFSNRLVRAVFELKMIDINGIYKEPDKDKMSSGCAYTFDFVINSPIERLFTFKLSEDVEAEFADSVSAIISRITGKTFRSLALLDQI